MNVKQWLDEHYSEWPGLIICVAVCGGLMYWDTHTSSERGHTLSDLVKHLKDTIGGLVGGIF